MSPDFSGYDRVEFGPFGVREAARRSNRQRTPAQLPRPVHDATDERATALCRHAEGGDLRAWVIDYERQLLGRAEGLMHCLGEVPSVSWFVSEHYTMVRPIGPLEVWRRH